MKRNIKKTNMTKSEMDFIFKNYKDYTANGLAKQLGRNYCTIKKFLLDNNLFDEEIHLEQHRLKQEYKQFIIDNYKNKTSVELSKILKISIGMVGYYLKSLGLSKKTTKNLINKKFGKLTVKKFYGSMNGIRQWECICECGSIVIVPTYSLTSKHTKTCGCGRIESISKVCGYISGSWYGSIKRSAKNRKLEFSISQSFLNDLLIKQNFKCAISGLPIKIVLGRGNPETTASVDRIDNSIGYTKDNVWFVHKDINYMKYTHTMEYFIKLCHTISKFQKAKDK